MVVKLRGSNLGPLDISEFWSTLGDALFLDGLPLVQESTPLE